MEENYLKEISKEPINVLFGPPSTAKKDVWSIDLVGILEMLIEILEKSGKSDLNLAGMAALSSSLIYKMKVESIFALQKAAMEKKPLLERRDVDIQMIDIPYRHEPTYPVSLDDLLGMLQNLIGAMANPKLHNRGSRIEPVEPPDFDEYFVSFENLIKEYEDLVLRKISSTGTGLLHHITEGLDRLDSIRCFFAILFLARDEKIEIEQDGDDIRITLAASPAAREDAVEGV